MGKKGRGKREGGGGGSEEGREWLESHTSMNLPKVMCLV